jgi:hypothetical protein
MRDRNSIFIKTEDQIEKYYNIAEITWLGEVKFMKPVMKLESYHLARIANASARKISAAFELSQEEAAAGGYKANV